MARENERLTRGDRGQVVVRRLHALMGRSQVGALLRRHERSIPCFPSSDLPFNLILLD